VRKRRNSRAAFLAALVAAVALHLAGPRPGVGAGSGVVIDRVVATVNGEAITLYDLYKAELPTFGRVLLPDETTGRDPEARARERELLEKMIEEKLILQRVKERRITILPEEIDEAIERIKAERKVTDEMLADGLQARGMTIEEYRDRLSKQMLIARVVGAEVRSKIVITPEEVAVRYRKDADLWTSPERIRIRHILVMKRDGEDPSVGRALAVEAQAALAAGTDFIEAAGRFSQDPPAARGEMSGWLQKGDTLPELEKVIFGLAEGRVSPIIETTVGFHLVRIEEREESSVRSIEEVTPDITRALGEERVGKFYQDWLNGLRKEAVITVRL
jgi:peptidyl-prolyl cis-trans isomerase SurA